MATKTFKVVFDELIKEETIGNNIYDKNRIL